MFQRLLTLLFVVLSPIGLSACSASGASAPTASPTPAGPRAPRVAPPVRGAYAALGASETYGVGAQPPTKGYAYLVAHALHAHPFVDVGIPGATLSSAYQQELTSALNIRPSVCTAFFGFNDVRAGVTRSAFLRDLNDLVATLRLARCKVLVIGLPNLSLLPSVKRSGVGGVGQIIASWNRGMKSVAARHGARFLDLSGYSAELASHPAYISPDGLHPSNIGHARLAQVVLAALRRFGMTGK